LSHDITQTNGRTTRDARTIAERYGTIIYIHRAKLNPLARRRLLLVDRGSSRPLRCPLRRRGWHHRGHCNTRRLCRRYFVVVVVDKHFIAHVTHFSGRAGQECVGERVLCRELIIKFVFVLCVRSFVRSFVRACDVRSGVRCELLSLLLACACATLSISIRSLGTGQFGRRCCRVSSMVI
jgi:hypothetical protein